MPCTRVILNILRAHVAQALKQGLGEILCRELVKRVPGKGEGTGKWEASMEFEETIV